MGKELKAFDGLTLLNLDTTLNNDDTKVYSDMNLIYNKLKALSYLKNELPPSQDTCLHLSVRKGLYNYYIEIVSNFDVYNYIAITQEDFEALKEVLDDN